MYFTKSNRVVNAVAKRHVGMKIESSQYIRPAVAYVQELITLASEKGFIMSRVNAREISNRLSEVINHDIIDPMLKVGIQARGTGGEVGMPGD